MAKKAAFQPVTAPRLDPRKFRHKSAIKKRRTLREQIRLKFNVKTLQNHLKEMSAKHETHQLESDKNPTPIYPYYRIFPTDGDLDCYEKSDNYSLPSRIGGQEFGRIIKKYLKFTEGLTEDPQMKEAKKLYKSQTYPAFNSEATDHMIDPNNTVWKWLNLLYSQCGVNRQGVWMPLRQGITDDQWAHPTALRKYGFVSPMLGKLSLWYEIRENLLTDTIKDWLTSPAQQSADIYFAIPSIQDIVTISNVMKYSPVDLKIYICKCKTQTRWSPAACWFNPTEESLDLNDDLMTDGYRYVATDTTLTYPGDSPTGQVRSETSVNVGATPKFSPLFRTRWDIIDVLNQVIEPTEKFELTIDRHFRKAMSGRDLEQGYQTYTASSDKKNENGYWQEGDISLLVTFRGLSGILKNGSGDAEKLREVDHTPAKIMMQSRSSFQIAANDVLNSVEKSGKLVAELSAYVSSTARILDTTILNSAFTDSTWEIDVNTVVENETGGSR